MSEFFSPLYDNGLDTRSNSLITNELFVKDPLTDEYKKVLPGGGGGDGGAVRPYYIDDDEINFGTNATKITSSKAEFRDTTTRHSELNFSNLKIHNAGAETKYQVGAISWKDSENEDEKTMLLSTVGDVVEKIAPIEYLENTEILFQPLNNVYSKIRNNSVKIGLGSSTNSTQNNSTLNYDGLYVTGSSGNNTVYQNGSIKKSLSGVTKTLNLINIMDSQTNYLKPDKIEFADGSGISEGILHYRDGEGQLKQNSLVNIAEAGGVLPVYIEPYNLDFSKIDSDFVTKVSGMEITANISTVKNEEKTTHFTPDWIWHTDPTLTPNIHIQASYPLIINGAKKLDGVEYIKPTKIEFADGSGISEGILHYRDGEGQLKQNSLVNIAEADGVLPNFIKSNSIQFDDDSSPGFSRIEEDAIGTHIFSAEELSGTSTQYGPTKIIRNEVHFGGVEREADVNDVIDVTNKFKDVTAAVGTINGIHSKFGGAGANPAFNSTNIQTSLLKIMAITADAADINTVTNNLKDLESTAAQIDAAVANSGGGATYDYLKSNSVEIDTDTNATTSFRSIGPSAHTQITSKEFRAYKTATNNYAFNNTTVDGNGMVIKGNTSDSFTEYGNNDIWVSTGTQSYNASVQDIITSTNKIKDFSANDINDAISSAQVNIIKVRSVSPTDTLQLHTTYSAGDNGTPNVDTLTIPDEPGTYILSFVGDWGSTSGWGIKTFYLYGPINRLMTINARFSSTGSNYVMVSPIMRGFLPKNGFMMHQFNVQSTDPSPTGDITDGLSIIFTVSNQSVGTDNW